MNRLHFQYGAAVLAAPLFIVSYNFFTSHAFLKIPQVSDFYFLVLFVIVYPVIEELFFRGMVQEFIANKITSYTLFETITAANLLTSLLFVLMHLVYNPLIFSLLVFIPSMIFGYFKEHYGTVKASIFLHMFYNLSALFMISPLSQL